MNFDRFENEGVVSSYMFAVIADIVEQVKYNNKETAEASVGILLDAKVQEQKVVWEHVRVLWDDIKKILEETERINSYILEHFEKDVDAAVNTRDSLFNTVKAKQKEIRNAIHNFKREVAVLDSVVGLIKKIDFTKSGTEKIKHILSVSTDILETYRKNMLPRACDCNTGHSIYEVEVY